MTNKTDTTQALRARIIRRYGSIADFAKKTGIPRARIYQFMNRESLPGLEVFFELAAALDFQSYELVELARMLGVELPEGLKGETP